MADEVKTFKVGAKVTYKKLKDCTSKTGRSGSYYCGGTDEGGFVGIVESYSHYETPRKCYKINVTTRDGGNYSMLEDEFVEYDALNKSLDSDKQTEFRKGMFVAIINSESLYVSEGYVYKLSAAGDCFVVEKDNDGQEFEPNYFNFKNTNIYNTWRFATVGEIVAYKAANKPVPVGATEVLLEVCGFKVGDYVLGSSSGSGLSFSELGMRFKVTKVSMTAYSGKPAIKVEGVSNSGHDDWIGANSFRSIVPKEEKKLVINGISVGDMVKVVKAGAGQGGSDIGKSGIVTEVSNTGYGRTPGFKVEGLINVGERYNNWIGATTFKKVEAKTPLVIDGIGIGDSVEVILVGEGAGEMGVEGVVTDISTDGYSNRAAVKVNTMTNSGFDDWIALRSFKKIHTIAQKVITGSADPTGPSGLPGYDASLGPVGLNGPGPGLTGELNPKANLRDAGADYWFRMLQNKGFVAGAQFMDLTNRYTFTVARDFVSSDQIVMYFDKLYIPVEKAHDMSNKTANVYSTTRGTHLWAEQVSQIGSVTSLEEEAIRRFPIGSKFVDAVGNTYTVKEGYTFKEIDSNVKMVDSKGSHIKLNSWYAYVYTTRKWATLVDSNPIIEECKRRYPAGTFIYGADFKKGTTDVTFTIPYGAIFKKEGIHGNIVVVYDSMNKRVENNHGYCAVAYDNGVFACIKGIASTLSTRGIINPLFYATEEQRKPYVETDFSFLYPFVDHTGLVSDKSYGTLTSMSTESNSKVLEMQTPIIIKAKRKTKIISI